MYEVCIIGGGISGMLAGIMLAKGGVSVVICESNDRLGKKLLATGNGRANLSNTDIDVKYYNTDSIAGVLRDADFVREIWHELGLLTRVENGRIYPYSEQASSVLNVCLANIEKYGVHISSGAKVSRIDKAGDKFAVCASDRVLRADRVCLATGSSASFGIDSGHLYSHFGHSRSVLRPGLCPMPVVNVQDIKGLSGVRQDGVVSLYVDGRKVAEEYGEVQFRRDSVSGIVIFNHSSRLANMGAHEAEIGIDFMPTYTLDEVQKLSKNAIMTEHGLLNKYLINLIKSRGIDSIKDYRIKVRASEDKSQSQVMCGGLDIADFDLVDMSSKKCDGLYALGEVLNVNGLCGGYNIHWATVSAYNFAMGVLKDVAKTR